MRKWSRRIWLGLGLAAVLGATGAVWWSAASGRGGNWVDAQFLVYTNPPNYSRGLALFIVSNRTDRVLLFDALPEFHKDGQWPKAGPWGRPWPTSPLSLYSLDPHGTHVFRMLYPEDGRAFRAVVYYRHPHTRWEARRVQWAAWLVGKKLVKPARWIAPRAEVREVRSEERRWPGKTGP